MPTVVNAIEEKMTKLIEDLEGELQADVLGIFGPIMRGVEYRVKAAIEKLPTKRDKVAVLLSTNGGSIEVTERIVTIVRNHYKEVVFVVPDLALSAGTVLVMSGDAIMMNYFSCLGPIDPQVEREGRWVPALSYLEQYRGLVAKGNLATAELALVNKLDLAELQQFEQAKLMTEELLLKWLAKYKFKNWQVTDTRKIPVTQQMREDRAKEIATSLNDQKMWKSHGRGISMDRVRSELKLVVEDFSARASLESAVKELTDFITNCMNKERITSLVTSRKYV